PPPDLPIQNPKSKIENQPTPPADPDAAEKLRRRSDHMRKLDEFNLACRGRERLHFEFDPADGPLPTWRNHPAHFVSWSVKRPDQDTREPIAAAAADSP